MFSAKELLKGTRFEINKIYYDIEDVKEIDVIFTVTPQVSFSMLTSNHILVLSVYAAFVDTYLGLEIIAYEGVAKAVLSLTNRNNDKGELIVWLRHIQATVRGFWKTNCPIICSSVELTLDTEKYSGEILDYLEAENLYEPL